jgi:uncharacterized protein (TIGR04255 family)
LILDFPHDRGDVVFRKAPLIAVLCQVKFPEILSLLAPDGVLGFQEGLRDLYPRLENETNTAVQVAAGSLSVANAAPVWRMKSEDGHWEVSTAIDFVALQTDRYRDFGVFSERLRTVLRVLERTVHPDKSTRIGLRKINELSYPSVRGARGWKGLLRPELLGLLSADDIDAPLASTFSETTFGDGDRKLAIRHGVLPDEPRKYRLDLDYFTEERFEITPDGELIDLLTGFSRGLTSYFIWSLEEDLFVHLGPQPRKDRKSVVNR